MNKFLLTIGIIATVVLLTGGWFLMHAKKEKPALEGATVVAFGDSLTSGYGTTEGKDYVSLLSAKIGEPIINLGLSGDTASSALNRVDEAISKDPKFVIVFLGGNDVLQKIPIDETFIKLDEIVRKITESGARVAIVAVPGALFNDPYTGRFKDLAQKYDAIYVPQPFTGVLGNKKYMYDSVHPNDEGHLKIANKIYDAIKGEFEGEE